MSKQTILYLIVAIIIGGLIGYGVSKTAQKPNDTYAPQRSRNESERILFKKEERGQKKMGYESTQTCLDEDCLAVEGVEYPVGDLPENVVIALNDAIQDEYKARATYEAVIAKFGSIRPFIMIKGAEERHIASLKSIFDKYGIDVPANSYPGTVTAPESVQEACAIGVSAEIANAALYKDKLLPVVTAYPDITNVFENLMNASQQKHLPAFERCS